MLLPLFPRAETVRLATWGVELSRDGPGLALHDLTRDAGVPQIEAVISVLAATSPDILLLTDIDVDPAGATVDALVAVLAARGIELPYSYAPPSNAGLPTGADLDGDGKRGTARDAQGYGRFRGDGAMALLSRWPIDRNAVRDLTALLWRDVPGATLPTSAGGAPFPSDDAQAIQRLSSTGHWIVPVLLPTGGALTVLAYAATPPVFDGPEDRNGLRAADETGLWRALLDGRIGPAPRPPFAVMGRANLDPLDGDGRHDAIAALLADPRLQDPQPRSAGGSADADPDHLGDPALDTVDWRASQEGGPGNLRVDYVLPSAGLAILGAGVHWPEAPDTPAALASRHRLVWVDVAMPRGPAADAAAVDHADPPG